MKFGSSVEDIFVIQHTQFGWDAFGFDVSMVHCLGLQFFVDTCINKVLLLLIMFLSRAINTA